MRTKLLLAGLCAACALGVVAWGGARATPPQGAVNTPIVGPVAFDPIDALVHTPDFTAVVKTRGPSDGRVVLVTIAPGGNTGWHSHPGIVFALVRSGTLTVYHDDGTSAVYPAGTGFVEEPGDVHIAVNEGATTAEVVAFFLLPRGAPPRSPRSSRSRPPGGADPGPVSPRRPVRAPGRVAG
jgi:quercetin dioxygenase-like cupin family protein